MRLDPDQYLTVETFEWCRLLLDSMKLPSPPFSTQFIRSLDLFAIPDFLIHMIRTARQHEYSGALPILATAPHPVGAWNWTPTPEIAEGLQKNHI
jgi:hypothetical protein